MTITINNKNKKTNVPNSTDKGNVIRNVPHLRFPEFEGEWEKCKLGDKCDLLCGYAFDGKNIVEQGTYLLMRGINITEGIIRHSSELDRYYTGSVNNLAKYKLTTGDLVIGMDGSKVGRNSAIVSLTENGSYLVQRVCRIKSCIGNDFILQLVNNHKFHKYVDMVKTSSAIPHISLKDIQNFPIAVPSIQKEADKISRLFHLLDERIATQNKIIEDLKKLKSAIIEKVFCSPNKKNPMCRIEGFEQALSTYKMSDFSSRIATKNKDSKCSLVLTIAAQYGLVNQESFFNKSVASENLTGYYLLHKGEFAYNRSYSAGYDWGAVKRLDNYDEGVLSTLYICFKINETIVDSDYLTYYFESTKWHRGLSDIAGEGARNHGLLNVSITDYFNTKHRFPVIEEQKAIAKMLNTITEKERKATLLGECYQKQKQYLLRQMFI